MNVKIFQLSVKYHCSVYRTYKNGLFTKIMYVNKNMCLKQTRPAKKRFLFLQSPVSLSFWLVLQKFHLHGFHGNSAVLLIFYKKLSKSHKKRIHSRLMLRPVSKPWRKRKGKKSKKKKKQLSPEPDNFLLFGITSENCKKQAFRVILTTNKLLELIISSHGQHTQVEPPAEVLVICHTPENSSSRRPTSRKLLFSFIPHWNEGCELPDKTLGVWNRLSKTGSGWENPVGDPSFTAHRKVKRSLATGKLQAKSHFCCLLCLPI